MIKEFKSEAQLQYECVKWFNNNYKEFRGCLVEINNSTNKGAYRKSMGQVKGASDLVLFNKTNGLVLFIELKLNGSVHKVAHLNTQLDWLDVMNKKFETIFCFGIEMFQEAVSIFLNGGDFFGLVDFSSETKNFVRRKIKNAESRGVKSVKLDYYGK